MLADDRFLERVLGQRVEPSPEVSLDELLAAVSAEYGVSEVDLRGPSRKRVICEARAVIGWLSQRLRTCSIKDVATYFRREASTFSRHIGNIDVKAKHSDQFRDRLNRHINTIAQA